MSDDVAPDMEGLQPWVQAAIRSFCGWHVAPLWTQTVVLNGDGSNTLFLPSLHVTDVLAVQVDGQDVHDFRWTTAGVLYLGCGLTRRAFYGAQQVKVTFTHGYSTPPADLLQAGSRMAAAPLYSSMSVDGVSVKGGASVFTHDNPVGVMLEAYRLPGLP